MRTYLDAKAMAKSLRAVLSERQIEFTHSDCLEVVAQQFGLKNWNVLSARINADAVPIDLKAPIPLLRSFSEDKAVEFYVDFLGFKIDWRHRFGDNAPLYMQITRSDATLHLSEHHGDASPGSTVFLWMRGIAEYHRELSEKNYRHNKPGFERAPWEARILEVRDPFGNRLLFNEHDTDKERRR
ncbi:MAG: glyoxalase superfamily protein [Pseudomonadota bacterium]